MGKYLYCVIQANEPKEFGPIGIGGRGDPLYTVNWQDLACVISDSPLDDYPVSRENTMAHHQAIETVGKEFPALLPVAFNTIAKAEGDIIEKVLKPRRGELIELLEWVADKEEVSVRASWRTTDPVFQKILEEHPGIRTFRDKLAKLPPAARYYDQIELGKQVEGAFKAYREEEEKRVLDSLKPHAVDVRVNPIYGERSVLNAAFLVAKNKVSEFVRILEKLAEPSDGNLHFKYISEGAPFHFVEIRITWEEESHVHH